MGDPIVDLAQSCLPFTPVPPGILKDKPELAWLVASALNTSNVSSVWFSFLLFCVRVCVCV